MSFTRGVQIFFVQNEKMLKILVCKARIFVLLIILVLVNVVDNIVDLASQARVLFHGLFDTVHIVHNGGVVFLNSLPIAT